MRSSEAALGPYELRDCWGRCHRRSTAFGAQRSRIQEHRNAPLHFQRLGAEMHLLHRALKRLLEFEAYDEEEKEWLH